jgi:putative peptidoglycan lipid II flippase
MGLLFALPAAAALVALAFPLTSVLFERGAFDALAAKESARALLAFALGLPAFVLVKVLLPGFYARGEPKPPVKIAAFCVAVNAALNAALIGPLGVMGIGLATSAAGWLNVALLARGLRRRGYFELDPRLRRNGPRIVLATLVMVGILELLLWALTPAFTLEALAPRAGALAALVLGGLFVYGLAARLLGLVRFNDLLRLFRRAPAGPPAGPPGLTE